MAPYIALAAIISALIAARRRHQSRFPAQAVIISPRKSTVIAKDGAVRSVQSAKLTVSSADMAWLWNPMNLENLARTYWRFLSRVTLGLIRVVYGENERSVVLLGRPLTLLRFDAPEYTFDPERGSVRWRIKDGFLVARSGRGCGYLAVEVRREPVPKPDGPVDLYIEVAVTNFYPAIAANFSSPVYEATQSSIHVLVTHAFLRSLAKLDLARSKVGRFAPPVPATPADPATQPPTQAPATQPPTQAPTGQP